MLATVLLKNYNYIIVVFFILYAKRIESGSLNETSYLKQGSEINDFDLKQGQGFKASAAHSL